MSKEGAAQLRETEFFLENSVSFRHFLTRVKGK